LEVLKVTVRSGREIQAFLSSAVFLNDGSGFKTQEMISGGAAPRGGR